MLRGGHRPGVTLNHNCCAGGTWYVELPREEMETKLNVKLTDKSVETCHVPFGSVLLFNNLIPHRSMENMSNDIRWSLDLRWFVFIGFRDRLSMQSFLRSTFRQKPEQPNGFYGLKENILMAKENQDDFQPDWEQWSNINRTKLQEAAVKQSVVDEIDELKGREPEDPFDTTISGPWMHNWPIVHHNRHTAMLKANSTSWHKA